MKRVCDVMPAETRPLIAISGQDNLQQAATLMSKHRLGALPVICSSGCVGGILSRRDLLSAVANGQSLDDVLAGDLMTKEIIAVPETESLEYTVELMRRAGVKHLPVTRAGEVVGVASWGPMVFALEEELRAELALLQEYVFGR